MAAGDTYYLAVSMLTWHQHLAVDARARATRRLVLPQTAPIPQEHSPATEFDLSAPQKKAAGTTTNRIRLRLGAKPSLTQGYRMRHTRLHPHGFGVPPIPIPTSRTF